MLKTISILIGVMFVCSLSAQSAKNTLSDTKEDRLLTQYLLSKGPDVISFDSSNIKQFWIDNSVICRNGLFEIIMKANKSQLYESIPLRIQVVNVNEAQDCKVEVISETDNFEYVVLNDTKKVISVSSSDITFVNYTVVSSIFHLEDTSNTSFYLVFKSNNNTLLSIKKIILSFSKNNTSSFLSSPGILKLNQDNTNVKSALSNKHGKTSFSVKGNRSAIFSSNKILLSDKPLSSSVSIKNTGDKDTRVLIGYAVHSKEGVLLDAKNYPYNNKNIILNVVSSSEEDKTIIVDSYPEWKKNCYLAFNAKDDMTDIPNVSLIGKVIEIKQLDNGNAEITLDKPLSKPLKEGEKVRVQGLAGSYLYTNSYVLRSGEEKEFNSTIQRDNQYFEYSPKSFSRGVYYVVPLILSYSVDPNDENTILITNYEVSF